MMRTLSIMGVLAAALPLGQQTSPAHVNLITVTGTGTVMAKPDTATINFGIQAQAPNAQAAQVQASKTGSKITSALRGLGFSDDALRTSTISITPLMSNPGPNSAAVLKDYMATDTVEVHVEDLTKVGPAIDAAVQAGANEVDGLTFGLRDDTSARQSALKDAVAIAKAKASAIAEALGMSLGGPYEVVEDGDQGPRPMAAMTLKTMATEVLPGAISVNETVTIRYRIAEK